MFSVIFFECVEFSACSSITVKCGIYMRAGIDLPKPCSDLFFHLVHMFFVRAKDDIFAVFLCHVFLKYMFQTICVFQCTAQLFEQLLVFCDQSLIR